MSKCLKCKKKKVLVERSDYCEDCYSELSKRIEKVIKKITPE